MAGARSGLIAPRPLRYRLMTGRLLDCALAPIRRPSFSLGEPRPAKLGGNPSLKYSLSFLRPPPLFQYFSRSLASFRVLHNSVYRTSNGLLCLVARTLPELCSKSLAQTSIA